MRGDTSRGRGSRLEEDLTLGLHEVDRVGRDQPARGVAEGVTGLLGVLALHEGLRERGQLLKLGHPLSLLARPLPELRDVASGDDHQVGVERGVGDEHAALRTGRQEDVVHLPPQRAAARALLQIGHEVRERLAVHLPGPRPSTRCVLADGTRAAASL